MKTYLLFYAILLGSYQNSEGQILKKLEKKAKESVERTLERKTEEKVANTTEKAIDSVFEAPKRNSKKNHTKKEIASNGILTRNTTVEIEDRYLFQYTATIELEDFTNKNSKTVIKQGYGDQSLITTMEQANNPIIIDLKNQSAIMLNINKGTAQIIALDWMKKITNNTSYSSSKKQQLPKVEKTGNSISINGNTCHEYNIYHEGGFINAWFAPNVPFHYQDYLSGMNKLFDPNQNNNSTNLLPSEYGYLMLMTMYSKEKENNLHLKLLK